MVLAYFVHRKRENNPFVDLCEDEFKDRYRFSKNSVRELIELIRPSLEGTSTRGTRLPLWKKVLVALRIFASGTLLREAGDLTNISESSACRYVHKVALAICRKLRKDYIIFPKNQYAQQTKDAFYRLGRFPGILSAIDGTHIPIVCPSTDDKEEYRNRKGYFSINVFAAVGAKQEFTNIVARWKGSTHDSQVFKNSSLYARFEQNEFNGVLIGDSGYECNRLPSYPSPLTNCRQGYKNFMICRVIFNIVIGGRDFVKFNKNRGNAAGG
ncbi:putative nuclease HARBI1 [Macrosteles quadrilineatus]|uniref:putative nuclease HARBI1 n=1 Tax=Macrosteles quadrilineatus TaxID=74068 RepID=UPI0023E339D5|nr:putative nuclease HARBI1 [Macrosteles quadrilineatus]